MSDATDKPAPTPPKPIGAFLGSALDPLLARRGFATADLIQAWGDIIGPRYARCTQPEKLIWPRREAAGTARGATLVIRVDQGMAIYLQHETSVILERLNGFLGFGAVAAIRLNQAPVELAREAAAREAPLSPRAEAAATAAVAEVESDGLREALLRLGRLVHGAVERS